MLRDLLYCSRTQACGEQTIEHAWCAAPLHVPELGYPQFEPQAFPMFLKTVC
jgi:hypothetical protein